jgi:hypothetical protein
LVAALANPHRSWPAMSVSVSRRENAGKTMDFIWPEIQISSF